MAESKCLSCPDSQSEFSKVNKKARKSGLETGIWPICKVMIDENAKSNLKSADDYGKISHGRYTIVKWRTFLCAFEM